jgi:hypothetical protein
MMRLALRRSLGLFGVTVLVAALGAVLTASSAFAASVCGTAGTQSGKTCTYTTTGQDTFTVPSGVTHVQVVAIGGAGAGGGTNGGTGGKAATVTADLPVTAGATYYVEVGAAGAGAGAGGGASAVQTCSTAASGCTLTGVVGSDPRLIVAAGGGGGGAGTSTSAPGGNGGNAGTGAVGSSSGTGGAGSNSTTTGGSAGGSADYTSASASAPAACSGGNQGTATSGGAGAAGTAAGGSGGAGWFGGDGGCAATDAGGGGGAGLSYVAASASAVSVAATTATPEVVVSFLDTTSTQISCAPADVPSGSSASCSVYVVDDSANPTNPTGTVSFTSNGLGSFSASSCTLSASGTVAGYCNVTYTPSSFNNASSTQTLSATYGGDSTHTASQGTTTVSTSPHPTATAVSCSPSSVTVAGDSTCTVTVRDTSSTGFSTPTGNVTFGANPAGTFSPASACTLASTTTFGTASCSVSYAPAAVGNGQDTITADYLGDSSHSASSSSTTLGVAGHPTSTALGCVNAAGQLGVPITCTVTVSDSSGVTPTGTVSFSATLAGAFAPAAGCTLAGTATAGQAACSISFTPTALGNATINAAFAAEGVLAPSGAATAVSVGAVATRLAGPTTSKRFLSVGQRVILATTVSAAAGSAQVSGGSVTFHTLDGHRLCVAAVGSGGHASCATTALGLGFSDVVASYSGATGFLGSTSGKLVERAFPGITIIIRSPRRRGVYRRGQFVRVFYVCRATVGLARRRGCVATQRDHQRLNTRTLGRHVFRVTVTTRAGIRRTVTVVYRVIKPRR